MVKKHLNNNKGGVYIWLIVIIVIFSGLSAIVFDFGNIYLKAKKIKYSINQSVKAAAIPIKEGEELANGVFLIDEVKGEENFNKILAHNLGLSESSLEPKTNSILQEKPIIKEFKVENNFPKDYTSATLGTTYKIEHPTVIAVIQFEVKGIFLKRTFTVAKLSSSQLTSIYD